MVDGDGDKKQLAQRGTEKIQHSRYFRNDFFPLPLKNGMSNPGCQ